MRIAALGSLHGGYGRRMGGLAQVTSSEADAALTVLEQLQASLDAAWESISRAERSGYDSTLIATLRQKYQVLEGRYDALTERYADLDSGDVFDRWLGDADLLRRDVANLEQTTSRETSASTTSRNVKIVGVTILSLLVVGGGFYLLSRRPG